jgi:hypothetical protein
VKPAQKMNTEIIGQTIRIWEPRSQRQLSHEDARQIVENVTGFFDVLAEWAAPDTSQGGGTRQVRRPARPDDV